MGTTLGIVVRRLLAALPNLVGVVVITFLLTRALPGDPAAYFAGGAATQEAVDQVRHQLGLDKSLPEQFLHYVAGLVRGDFGTSLTTGQPVLQELLTRLPASIEMVLLALLLACAIALPLGVMAATRPGSWIDQLCRLVTTAGVSLPTFFTGLVLAYVFYFLLGWAPAPLGRLDPVYSPPPTVTGLYLIDALFTRDAGLWWAAFRQLILPTLTMALFVLAPIARMTRASMLQVLSSDFVRTARASGLSNTTVRVRYALRNALLPVVTTLGMVFGFMLGSSVIIEKVFGWPGVGSYAIDALTASDYAPVQGFVLAMGVLFVLLNLLVDVLYTLIDPRISLGGA
jgi:peptide/nickel transport system permease protein